jgi:NAD(P)H-hydrate epimerase
MLTDRWPLVTAAEMRALDRHTIEVLGVPGELLMECAGSAVAAQVLALRGSGAEVWIYCGPGNNGGDGLVVARRLHLAGVSARLVLIAPPARYAGEAARNFERARRAGVPIARGSPPRGAVLVDAIFGTGLARRVEGAAARAIRRINACRPQCVVVAVDVPSGIDADTGQPLGCAVEADLTVALGLPKAGLTQEPARSLAGRVVVARIGIADEAPGVAPQAELWTRAAAARALPRRPRAGHKGSFGHVLIAGGSTGKAGAAALAAAGAARGGAGLVTIACPRGLNAVLQRKRSESMTAPLPESGAGSFSGEAVAPLLALARERAALVLGPGCGRDAATRSALRAMALGAQSPLVLDADGLVAFEGRLKELGERRASSILTPHPGEAGLLLGLSPKALNTSRFEHARRLAAESGAVVVLKGAGSVIADPSGRVVVNPTGGPVLATGGTGDVLAGLAGALLAQGCAAFEAAALAAFVHGAAGDWVAARRGSRGALAGEIAAAIPEALRSLAELPQRSIGPSDAISFPEPG